ATRSCAPRVRRLGERVGVAGAGNQALVSRANAGDRAVVEPVRAGGQMRAVASVWISSHWASLLTVALLHFVWQGALIGVATVSVLNGLRSARAATRYAVLCVALALLLASPIVTLSMLVLAPSLPDVGSRVFVTQTVMAVASSWGRSVVLPLWLAGVCICAIR